MFRNINPAYNNYSGVLTEEYARMLRASWDYFRLKDRSEFAAILYNTGLEGVNDANVRYIGGYKTVLFNNSIVIKFDEVPYTSGTSDEIPRLGYQSEHSALEVEKWLKSRRSTRRYLATLYMYYKGLLVQERVEPVCTQADETPESCPDSWAIAKRLRISHSVHHAHTKNGIKFFDTDSLGLEEIR